MFRFNCRLNPNKNKHLQCECDANLSYKTTDIVKDDTYSVDTLENKSFSNQKWRHKL